MCFPIYVFNSYNCPEKMLFIAWYTCMTSWDHKFKSHRKLNGHAHFIYWVSILVMMIDLENFPKQHVSLITNHDHKYIYGGWSLHSCWCKEHRIYLLILRSYRLKLQCSNHHVQRSRASRLSPHTRPPLVLADLLVSYLNRYESVHFGPERAPYI